MGGITLDIISRIKKYPHTLLFTIINDKNVEVGMVISTVPHLGHNFGYRSFCVTLNKCRYERIPKCLRLRLIVVQLRIELNVVPDPPNKLF